MSNSSEFKPGDHATVYRPGQTYKGADGDLLFVILPGDVIEFVTNRGTRVTVADAERVYAPLTLVPDSVRTEAEQLRATLDSLRALTHDEDGNLLPPESELPVGVFYGLLYGEEAGR